MVNSLQRLFTEIIETLDRAGQSVTDVYARSQVFAVIDILTNVAHRIEWKRSDLQVHIDDLRGLCGEIVTLLRGNNAAQAACPTLCERLMMAAVEQPTEDLQGERDRLSRLLIGAMEEVTAARTQLPTTVAAAIDQRCNAYLRRQLERDLALVRRPLFRQMSQA